MKPTLEYSRRIFTLYINGEGWRESCLDFKPGERKPEAILRDAIDDEEAYIKRLQARMTRLRAAL